MVEINNTAYTEEQIQEYINDLIYSYRIQKEERELRLIGQNPMGMLPVSLDESIQLNHKIPVSSEIPILEGLIKYFQNLIEEIEKARNCGPPPASKRINFKFRPSKNK